MAFDFSSLLGGKGGGLGGGEGKTASAQSSTGNVNFGTDFSNPELGKWLVIGIAIIAVAMILSAWFKRR